MHFILTHNYLSCLDLVRKRAVVSLLEYHCCERGQLLPEQQATMVKEKPSLLQKLFRMQEDVCIVTRGETVIHVRKIGRYKDQQFMDLYFAQSHYTWEYRIHCCKDSGCR